MKKRNKKVVQFYNLLYKRSKIKKTNIFLKIFTKIKKIIEIDVFVFNVKIKRFVHKFIMFVNSLKKNN